MRAWLSILGLGACLWGSAAWGQSLTVGSKKFAENRILAEIMALWIEAKLGIEVERKHNLGGTIVAFAALKAGQIDLYPEYTGTGWSVMLKKRAKVSDPLRVYARVQEEFLRRWQLRWGVPFGFGNSYAIAMRESKAQALGIRTLSQLARRGGQLKVGVSHEFLKRKDGYPGLAKAYGFRFSSLRGVEHGLAYKALASGALDVVDTWTTDGKLLRYPLRVLRDDKGFFPPYDAAPLVRVQALERHPRLGPLLSQLGYRLSNRRMQRLNAQVERGQKPRAVALAFLQKEGLLAAAPLGYLGSSKSAGQMGLWAFLWSRRWETLRLAWQHLLLVLLAMFLAVAASVPLGIALTRLPGLAAPVLNGVGVLQTIPSLALLAFMIPIPGLGLGARSAVAALFLYALLPIVRNTYTGIREIDPSLREAAVGMGLTGWQLLRFVELPLASRTIMAGIRTSTVISVGVATLGAFIGAGGLGEPIVTGLSLNDTRLILSGALPAASLAVAVDLLLLRLEQLLAPKGIEEAPG